MTQSSKRRRLVAAGLAALTLSAAFASSADAARRGGSFGSRGSRTWSGTRSPYGAGPFAAPISRSVTPNRPGGFQPGGMNANRPFGGPRTQGPRRSWVGPMLGGLAAGGLLGMMMGGGFGGGFGAGAGMFGGLLQILLIGAAVWFGLRFFRRRRDQAAFAGPQDDRRGAAFGRSASQPAAPMFGGAPQGFGRDAPRQSMFGSGGFTQQQSWGGASQGGQAQGGDDLGLGRGEVDALERTFLEVQEAYGREDYAGIRERCTPEVMSFMSEELARNATEGRKNEMRGFNILHSEVVESWREPAGDYATLAVRFSCLDWWTDRRTGQVDEGSPVDPTNTTEFWTFTRQPGAFGGGGWKVSAIQEEGR